MDLEARRQLMERLRQGFGEEFRVDGAFERQLGQNFRQHRSELEALLQGADASQGPMAAARAVLKRRSEQWAPRMRELRALESAGGLTQRVD